MKEQTNKKLVALFNNVIKPVLDERKEISYIELSVLLNKSPSTTSQLARKLAILMPEVVEYNEGILKLKVKGESHE